MSTKVAALSELAANQPLRVEVDGEPVTVVRVGDDVYAVHDTCSHAQASLSEGEVFDHEIECVLHGSMFSLDSGAPSCLPATKPVPTYAVSIAGDEVLVDATEPTNGAPVPDHF